MKAGIQKSRMLRNKRRLNRFKNEPWRNFSLDNITGEYEGNLYEEEWLPVLGYEQCYEISSFGRIKTLSRKLKRKGGTFKLTETKIMIQRLTKYGYLTVQLSRDKKIKWVFIHVLVGKHFLSNPENKPEVNHKWNNKRQNKWFELEWATKSENIKHSYQIGSHNQKGENHASNKLNNKQVLQIFNANGTLATIASRYNISFQMVSNIKTGRSWSHLTGKQYSRKNKLIK